MQLNHRLKTGIKSLLETPLEFTRLDSSAVGCIGIRELHEVNEK